MTAEEMVRFEVHPDHPDAIICYGVRRQRPDNPLALFDLLGELDALEAIYRFRTKIIKGEL